MALVMKGGVEPAHADPHAAEQLRLRHRPICLFFVLATPKALVCIHSWRQNQGALPTFGTSMVAVAGLTRGPAWLVDTAAASILLLRIILMNRAVVRLDLAGLLLGELAVEDVDVLSHDVAPIIVDN